MFSLRFDLLFTSLEMAKATAKKLNARLRRSTAELDPREVKRMRDELKAAREDVASRMMTHRNLFL